MKRIYFTFGVKPGELAIKASFDKSKSLLNEAEYLRNGFASRSVNLPFDAFRQWLTGVGVDVPIEPPATEREPITVETPANETQPTGETYAHSTPNSSVSFVDAPTPKSRTEVYINPPAGKSGP